MKILDNDQAVSSTESKRKGTKRKDDVSLIHALHMYSNIEMKKPKKQQ